MLRLSFQTRKRTVSMIISDEWNFLKICFLCVPLTVLYQKRLKKERRARRKMADQLDLEVKRRGQYEEALKSTSAETLRMINGECRVH